MTRPIEPRTEAGVRLLGVPGRKFSTLSVVPGNLRGVYAKPEYLERWCKHDATKLFRWLRKNLPTGTYNEFRRFIYLELKKDSE